MPTVRIALANLPIPQSREEAVALAEEGVAGAGRAGALLVCFPECFVPGYRWPGREIPPPDAAFLEGAWARVAAAARAAGVAVVLGTERIMEGAPRITTLVLGPDGATLGFQDKVQLDPSEDALYRPGAGRRLFRVGPLPFGVVICHEGFRYPETVRAAVRAGARLVLHPHYAEAEPGGFRPGSYADPRNSFHEAAARCRAAENGVFYATVNCASPGSPTTSAIVRPDGSVQAFQPYGEAGLLVADLDLDLATGFLAGRLRGAQGELA